MSETAANPLKYDLTSPIHERHLLDGLGKAFDDPRFQRLLVDAVASNMEIADGRVVGDGNLGTGSDMRALLWNAFYSYESGADVPQRPPMVPTPDLDRYIEGLMQSPPEHDGLDDWSGSVYRHLYDIGAYRTEGYHGALGDALSRPKFGEMLVEMTRGRMHTQRVEGAPERHAKYPDDYKVVGWGDLAEGVDAAFFVEDAFAQVVANLAGPKLELQMASPPAPDMQGMSPVTRPPLGNTLQPAAPVAQKAPCPGRVSMPG